MTAAEANHLRDEGMGRARDHADSRVVLAIDAAIERAIASGQPFSANDIREQFPTVSSTGLAGERMRAFAARRPRVMRRVGFEPSTLPSTRSAMVSRWQGVAR